jgi:Ala-tRNA(Pro) deacylase
MSSEQELMQDLAAEGVSVEVFEHQAVFTVDESAQLHATIPGAHTKNLFLKGNSGAFWLVTMPHHRRADLKFIAATLGERKLSFGKPDVMEQLLGVSPGAVTPLAAINDRERRVKVVIDKSFVDSGGNICVHPLRNTATVSMPIAGLLRMLERWQHAPSILNLDPQVRAG